MRQRPQPAQRRPSPQRAPRHPTTATAPDAHEDVAKAFYLVARAETRVECGHRVRASKVSRSLDLLGMALEVLPDSLSRLSTLTALHVNTNSLTTLPEQLQGLVALQKLNVRFNLLTALPSAVGALKALLTLDASNNKLESLPDALGELPLLHSIDVNTNQLASLPPSLCRLLQLKTLTLHTNRLTVLPEAIGNIASLRVLDVSTNQLASLPDSIGHLHALIELDISRNRLEVLPPSTGQMRCLAKLLACTNPLRALPACSGLVSLKLLDVEACSLTELPNVCEMNALKELRWRKNAALQKPPASVCGQGLDAMRRYFTELERAGATISRAARLVLIGDGLAGKTSLQRGLHAGKPQPTSYDARTIQLDLTTLTLFGGEVEELTFSVWDLGGQVDYAAAQQPYIAPGSLYVLVVPATRATDEHYEEVIGRWLVYLQAGAPAAYVLPVVTQCDRLLPEQPASRGVSASISLASLDAAAAERVAWVHRAIYWHNCRLDKGATRLRFHESISCVSSIAGGEASLQRFRERLEAIARMQPPPLLSIGQVIPKSWGHACAMLRALRDGADPEKSVRWQAEQSADGAARRYHGRGHGAPPMFASLVRPYITLTEAQQKWTTTVAPAMGLTADARVMHDALALLVNQGEVFSSCGIIYLQPGHVTSMLKPLVDHRLNRDWALPRAYEHCGEIWEDAPSVRLLLDAVEVLATSGELREELLPMLWADVDLARDDYAAVLLMLAESGVLFISEHTHAGRRWVMPMRLPELKPQVVVDTWETLPSAQKRQLSYSLRLAPPGIAERLMAACYGLGFYHRFWRRGALIRASSVPEGGLLIELRRDLAAEEAASAEIAMGAAPPLLPGGQLSCRYLLTCELRGPPDSGDALSELLSQVRLRADRLLRDFPGLGEIVGVVRGVDVAELEPTVDPASSYAAPPSGSDGSSDPSRRDLTRVISAAEAASALRHSFKYIGTLIYGQPIERLVGLHKLLGIGDPDDLRFLRVRGEDAIASEMAAFGAAGGTDGLGWTDSDYNVYCSTQAADERALPAGMPGAVLDSGHAGMRLNDFTQLPTASAAGLKRAHVLAVRLYTCSAYRVVNTALRNGCSLARPHPYPATVVSLLEAARLLRAAAQRQRAAERGRTPGAISGFATLWHGVAGVTPSAEFLSRGGTCMGILSCSPDRNVAERYARREGTLSALLLKLTVPNVQNAGADIAFLSAYPEEREVIYPPGTYLRPVLGASTVLACASVTIARGGTVALALRTIRIVEVLPVPREDYAE